MSLSCKVGGARGMFVSSYGDEVAGALDHAFGAESEWEGGSPTGFGDLTGACWSDFQERAIAAIGSTNLANLLAMAEEGGGVYLPAHVEAVTLPLAAGRRLRCASLPGLRSELAALADCWGLPQDDAGLRAILSGVEDGPLAEPPEVLTFARLALAANEAVRRDCPLWLVGRDIP